MKQPLSALAFVVTAGMQKSGSTLLHEYSKLLVRHRYGEAGQRAFEEWIRTGPVGGSGSFPWPAWVQRVDELSALSARHGPFVLKSHAPFPDLEPVVRGGNVKTVFIHRDPRDAVLSALDHGARSRANGDWPYAECVDVASTLPLVEKWCADASTWLTAPGVLRFRYEELVGAPASAVTRLAEFLEMTGAAQLAATVVAEEQAQRQVGRNQFNKGAVSRWREEMTAETIALCEQRLGRHIVTMGYRLTDPS